MSIGVITGSQPTNILFVCFGFGFDVRLTINPK